MDKIIIENKKFEELSAEIKWDKFLKHKNKKFIIFLISRDKTKKVNDRFTEKFQDKPEFYARAPGRVNLIGMFQLMK